MALSVIATGSQTGANPTGTLTITWSGGNSPQANDLILVYAGASTSGITWSATGFTFSTNAPVPASPVDDYQFGYKVATGSEGTTLLFTASGSHACSVTALLIRGANTGTNHGFDASGPPAGSGTVTVASGGVTNAPSITTSVNGCLLVYMAGINVLTGNTSTGDTVTVPSGYSNVVTIAGTASTTSDPQSYMASALQVSAGATGVIHSTDTTNATRNYAGLLVAVAPLPSATQENDPKGVQPAPPWQNRFAFGRLRGKASVQHDTQASADATPAVLEGIANFPEPTVTATSSAPGATDPYGAQTSPVWENRFGQRLHSKYPVDYDTQTSALVAASPLEANANFPAPTIAAGAGPTPAVLEATSNFPAPAIYTSVDIPPTYYPSKRAVLFDTPPPPASVSATVTPSALEAVANFPAPTVTGDANLTATVLEAIANFPAATVTGGASVAATVLETVASFPAPIVLTTNQSPDPQAVLPGPAWLNVFGPFAHSSKRAVEYDTQASAFVAPSILEAIANFPAPAVTAGASVAPTVLQGTVNFPVLSVLATNQSPDPKAVLPGPAWQNQFGPTAHSVKQSVLYDVQSSANVAATALQATANFPAVTVTGDGNVSPSVLEGIVNFPAAIVTVVAPSPTDPQSALPGPAWFNQFGRFAHNKRAVEYDIQSSANVSPAVLESIANFPAATVTGGAGVTPSPLEGVANFPAPLVSAANQSPDPESVLPGRAWQNQFGPFSHTAKRAVEYDTQASAYVTPVALEAVANFPAPTVTGGATIAATVLEAIANFPAVSVSASTPAAADPNAILPGPAWQNRFRGQFGKLTVQFDTHRGPFAFGPFCFIGAEADANLFGGTALDANAGLAGTAPDVNAGLGGTETDANPVTGVAGFGGTEADTNLFGGTFTDTNLYGGTEFGGCFN